jgi:ribosome maturation factor RimP
MRELVGGRRRFRGTLEGLEYGEVRLEVDLAKEGRQVLGLPLGLVGEARLVLTDDLVRESLRRAKRQDKAVEAENAEPADTARHRRAAKRGS